MAHLRTKSRRRTDTETLTWGSRLLHTFLALMFLAVMTALIKFATGASWWTVGGHMTLATCGACFLLLLFSIHIAHPDAARRRQFSIRFVLLTILGLGMMLAGIGGIFRLARFDSFQSAPQMWGALVGIFGVIFLLGAPLLAVLLETLVALANAAVRWRFIRWLLSGAGRMEKESDKP